MVCCVPYIAYIEVLKDETCKIEKQYAPGRAKRQTKNKQQALSSAPQIQTITASFAKPLAPLKRLVLSARDDKQSDAQAN